MRILFYTGKGGVGKTSVAAATAVRTAEQGLRTVILSTDLAHSLADSLDVKLGPEPTLVAPNLWAQEADVYHNIAAHWGAVQEWLAGIMRWQGTNQSLASDEMTVLPGMDELTNLLCIKDHRESGAYDVVVVDAAPTGETLRLLSFPEVMRWWMERIFPLQRRAMGVARPLLGAFIDVPLPNDRVFASIKSLFGQLDELHSLLVDPQLTSVRLVLNPEKMVVAEAERTFTYFNLFGYPCDLVIANRVLPADVVDPYFAGWRETQEKYLRQVQEGFYPLPIKQVPWFSQEVVGLPALGRLADALFGDENPARIFGQERPHSFERQADGSHILTMPLPFATRGDVHLRQAGDELFVHVGSHRRHIVLPRALLGLEVGHAKLREDEHELLIYFAPGPERAPEASMEGRSRT